MGAGVRCGLDVQIERGFSAWKGRRLGVLTHAAAVSGELEPILAAMSRFSLDLRVVFTPEHGLDGAAQDMQAVREPDGAGPSRVSLYGADLASLHPTAGALDEIDLLVVDLQDVGSRYYTYAVSMRYCMQACARAGAAVHVLDRPNPIDGLHMEGPLLQADLRSFVGGFEVPVRHGLTLAELARLACLEGVDVELSWTRAEGWERRMHFEQTGLSWVLPSPNMPSPATALVYPGACLVEGTTLSEGRGTTRPFELVGAPWLDGPALATELARRDLPGVRFRPADFTPTFHKHAGRSCHGVQVHVCDRDTFTPFACGVQLLHAARLQSPEDFAWRAEPYEFVCDPPAIDRLYGSARLRELLDAGREPRELAAGWRREVETFAEKRRPILLYA
ncbi:MAG: DUF1343 domain-containing protein [Deltaproteobacteria bacterium]|nr:DUF1343 domain-containing protein [Deltaproteobacteria bacterium]